MKYVLLIYYNNKFVPPKIFDTPEQARKAMTDDYNNVFLQEIEPNLHPDEIAECELEESSAWINAFSIVSHWEIFEISII